MIAAPLEFNTCSMVLSSGTGLFLFAVELLLSGCLAVFFFSSLTDPATLNPEELHKAERIQDSRSCQIQEEQLAIQILIAMVTKIMITRRRRRGTL